MMMYIILLLLRAADLIMNNEETRTGWIPTSVLDIDTILLHLVRFDRARVTILFLLTFIIIVLLYNYPRGGCLLLNSRRHNIIVYNIMIYHVSLD